ncbi:MAG: glutamate 5-kinase [Candidatus Omnitrophota bacterium]
MSKGIIVVKIGSAVLSTACGMLDSKQIKSFARQVFVLKEAGYSVVVISSGAVAAGISALGLSLRPKQLAQLQATAAVGQSRLMHSYEDAFKKYGVVTAQVLLTQDDFSERKRFINAKNTLSALINDYKVVPIINENDTIATEEIKFGDNDRLSSLVATAVSASTLVILTDVDGLYDPSNKKVISLVSRIDNYIKGISKPTGNKFGKGGMASKLEAASVMMQSGITCIIANGRTKNILLNIEQQKYVGTTFVPFADKAKARKSWLAFAPKSKGALVLDEGAKVAVVSSGRSLLAAGIKSVSGIFEAGDVVEIKDIDGNRIARGVVNFSVQELRNIKGLKSGEIPKVIKRSSKHNEVVHRDNLVLI